MVAQAHSSSLIEEIVRNPGGIFSVGLHLHGTPGALQHRPHALSGWASQTHRSPPQIGHSVPGSREVPRRGFVVEVLIKIAHVVSLFAVGAHLDVVIIERVDIDMEPLDFFGWMVHG